MMSIPSLFQARIQSKTDAETPSPEASANRSGGIAGLALLARHFRRRHKTRASYLNTGHLNDHVRRDIGLKRSDFTKPD